MRLVAYLLACLLRRPAELTQIADDLRRENARLRAEIALLAAQEREATALVHRCWHFLTGLHAPDAGTLWNDTRRWACPAAVEARRHARRAVHHSPTAPAAPGIPQDPQ